MVRRQRTRGRQVHPTGPLDTVDDPWKDDVRAVMERRGWTQKDLAEKIPVSPASITNMFKPGPRQIRFKARIEELCGWAVNAKIEEVLRRVHHKMKRLTPENADLVERMIDQLATKP